MSCQCESAIAGCSLLPLIALACRRILEPMCVLAGPAKGQQDWAMEVQMRESQLIDESFTIAVLTMSHSYQ